MSKKILSAVKCHMLDPKTMTHMWKWGVTNPLKISLEKIYPWQQNRLWIVFYFSIHKYLIITVWTVALIYCSRRSLLTFCYSILHVLRSEIMWSVFSNMGSSFHLIATCAEGASPGDGTCLKQLRPFMVDTHQRLRLYYLFYLFPSWTFLFFSSVFSLYPTPHVRVLSPCPASSQEYNTKTLFLALHSKSCSWDHPASWGVVEALYDLCQVNHSKFTLAQKGI